MENAKMEQGVYLLLSTVLASLPGPRPASPSLGEGLGTRLVYTTSISLFPCRPLPLGLESRG